MLIILILTMCGQIWASCQAEHFNEPLAHVGLDYIADSEFSYNDPSEWKVKYPVCDGVNQSPIDIDPGKCEKLPKGRSLTVKNEDYRPESVELINDHYTVKYLLTWYENKYPSISGKFLEDSKYIPRDIHFHWGRNDTQGSEHSINSRKYSLEMHIVCYNSKYGSVAEAKTFKDGILVIGQFFQVKNYAPNYFFLDFLPRVSRRRSKIVLKEKLCAFNFGEFLNVDAFKGSFVVYSGSFTTPPCYEDVTWVISLNVNSIDRRKMNFFREIQGLDGHLVDNYRPIQPANTRKCLVS